MKKVGILGSGIVARTLGQGFLKNGFEVMLGTRDASKLEEWQNENGEGARTGSFKECSDFGDIIVLAVKGTVAESLVKDIYQNLDGKTVIDASNPIEEVPPVNGVLKFFTSLDKSLMEELQEIAPKAHFVKAFNSVGSAFMINPSFELKPSMFIAGNNDAAKNEVKYILDIFGWETEDMGMAEAARAIEPLCMLWCIPGFRNGQWSHAFKLLKK